MKRRGKYITTDILLACLSTPPGMKKDIHTHLKETIAERRRMIQQWQNSFLLIPADIMKNIHTQPEETIPGCNMIPNQRQGLFSPVQESNNAMQDNKAA